MAKNKAYYEEVNMKNQLHLREILDELPPYCKQFFIGIEPTTASRTRLAYAYDLNCFFEFLHENNPICKKMKIKEIPIHILEELKATDIEEYLSYLKIYEKDGVAHSNDERGLKRKLSSLRSFYKYCYKHEMIDEDHLRYNGRNEILLTDKDFQKLLQGTPIELKKAKFERCNKDRELLENEFLYITNQTTYGTLLAKVRENFIVSLQYDSIRPFGVQPRNVGQRFAIEALLAPANELPLVILKGSAGTAKTFLTLACALQQCAEENIYRKITIADCLRNGDYNENEQDYIRTDQKITGSQCIYPTRQCLFTDTGIYRSLFDPCFHCFQTSCPYFTKAWL